MGVFDRTMTNTRSRRSPQSGAAEKLPLFNQPRATSKEAIHKLNDRDNDTLTERHDQILNALRELGPSTQKEVSDYLDIPINCLTGRFLELRDHEPKRIRTCGKKKNGGSGYNAALYTTID